MSQLVSYTVGQFDPSVFLLCHRWLTTTNLSYRFPILETSATALCGTTGRVYKCIDCIATHLKNIIHIFFSSLHGGENRTRRGSYTFCVMNPNLVKMSRPNDTTWWQQKHLKGGQPILKALRSAVEEGNSNFLQGITFDFGISTFYQTSWKCFSIWLSFGQNGPWKPLG